MAQCVKTGCTAYFPQYGTTAHGDLYVEGNTFILYGKLLPHQDAANYQVHIDMDVEFYEDTQPYNVWVTVQSSCTLRMVLKKYLGVKE